MMRPTDIQSGNTYAAVGGRDYFVETVRTTAAGSVVNYSIIAGRETGKRLSCSLGEFARRVMKKLPTPKKEKNRVV